ncbi:phytoene desaturase family protein [Bacillus horti]|uniref:4,4'-diaponeurosporene oxygenase n=1 Tax=Caldalkalibacillus horti TaxID=77523 RepID=A0ABT9W254_9BACI|nr:phytoene desaturase family protein [Bacillus horti]MDQ0167306.1 phytoene desaturase [Bacillus horti]
MKKVVVIGAGLGGLSCAVKLAHAGYQVTILEQQKEVGGKLQRVKLGDYSFDRGPSTITMPHAFKNVFEAVGRHMEDYVSFYKLNPATRNRFYDGITVDLTSDVAHMEEQLAQYSPEDARQYKVFMRESQALYEQAERHFMSKLLLNWKDKASLSMLQALLRIRPWLPLHKLLQRYFCHPHTLAMFGRYATYVGSSPYTSPSIFAMLAHVEASIGIYGVKGGTYSIVKAFSKLAQELGTEIKTSTSVKQIVVKEGKAVGVETNEGGFLAADLVVANGDVLAVNQYLLQEKDRPSMTNNKINKYEPSLSGFVTLLGVKQQYDALLHHTVFFPEQYGTEFRDIFERKVAPLHPAIYICYSGYSEASLAPIDGSNLFVLVNTPYTTDDWDWEVQKKSYSKHILENLKHYGIDMAERAIEQRAWYSPNELRQDTSAHRGAIYGISSNSVKQTFFRPSNRSNLENVWFVGGTTHPGGGTPMVTLSGQLVAEKIMKQA